MDGFRERLNGKFERNEKYTSKSSRYERSPESRSERPSPSQAPRRHESISINEIVNAIEKSNRAQLEKITGMFNDAKVDRLESERAIINIVSGRDIKSAKLEENSAPAGNAAVSSEKEDEILSKLNVLVAASLNGQSANKEQGASEVPSVSKAAQSIDTATLMRIERVVGQTSETLSENEEVIEKNYEILRSNEESLGVLKNGVSQLQSSQEELKSIVNETNSSIKESQEELKNIVSEVKQTVEKTLQEMPVSTPAPAAVSPVVTPVVSAQTSSEDKDEILDAIHDNRALLNMIRQDLLANVSSPAKEEEGEDKKEEGNALSATEAEKYYNELMEHVHVQCVKTYRNVQANLADQATELTKRFEKSTSDLRLFSVASICLNIVTIVLLLCRILGIL